MLQKKVKEEERFTQIPNKILEALVKMKFKGSEMATIMFVMRKTYGFHKKQDEISYSQFCLWLDRCKDTVIASLKNLQLANILILVRKGTSKRNSNLWRINEDYETWKLVDTALVEPNQLTSLKGEPELVDTVRHTKENITKENLQNKCCSRKPLREKVKKEEKLKSSFQLDVKKLERLSLDEKKMCKALVGKGCVLPDEFEDIIKKIKKEFNIFSFPKEIIQDVVDWPNKSTSPRFEKTLHSFCENNKESKKNKFTSGKFRKNNYGNICSDKSDYVKKHNYTTRRMNTGNYYFFDEKDKKIEGKIEKDEYSAFKRLEGLNLGFEDYKTPNKKA